jgi:hypothetical protein
LVGRSKSKKAVAKKAGKAKPAKIVVKKKK